MGHEGNHVRILGKWLAMMVWMAPLYLIQFIPSVGAEAPETPQSPCADNPTWKYEYALPAVRDRADFQVWFKSREEVTAYCGSKTALGCSLKSAAEPPQPWLVIVLEPTTDIPFNEREFQCILGHEVLHTMGFTHEAVKGVAPVRSKLFD